MLPTRAKARNYITRLSTLPVTNAKTHVTSEYIACEARELLQLFTLRVDVDTAYIDR